MSDLLTEKPSECLAPVIHVLATLDTLGIVPASINVEWRHTNRTTPYINVWMRYRTDFEAVTKALKLKTSDRAVHSGQHHYFTTGDTGPLIQCMSFSHQEDWVTA